MARIYICYRREDSSGYARALYGDLRQHFSGLDEVFMDVASLKPGVEFAQAIDKQVETSRVVIALIGPDWVGAVDADGRRRLDQPDDFVVRELSSALQRKITILPVRVRGAAVPSESALPPQLHGLVGLQAAELSDSRWDYDVGQLLDLLYAALGRSRATGGLAQGFTQSPAAALIQWIPVLPWISTAILLMVYYAPAYTIPVWMKEQPLLTALLGTSAVTLVAVLVISLVLRSTSADSASPNIYSEISERLHRLQDRQAALPTDGDSTSELVALQQDIERIVAALRTPGLQWVARTGYLGVLRMLHNAEEALIGRLPPFALAEEARIEQRRIRTSPLGGWALADKLQDIVSKLDARVSPEADLAVMPDLRSVREVMNDLAYKRAGADVNLRNRTLAVITVLGLTIALSVLGVTGNPVGTAATAVADPVMLGLLVYGVAAVVALVAMLIVPPPADEGYGLNTARLFLSPLLAGVVAVAITVTIAIVSLPPANMSPELLFANKFQLLNDPLAPVEAAIVGLAVSLLLNFVAARGSRTAVYAPAEGAPPAGSRLGE